MGIKITENRKDRKEYVDKMCKIAIDISELILKMSSTLTDYDTVMELQKAANHLAMASTISYYNDRIEEELEKENE